jgi:hypothetical protein
LNGHQRIRIIHTNTIGIFIGVLFVIDQDDDVSDRCHVECWQQRETDEFLFVRLKVKFGMLQCEQVRMTAGEEECLPDGIGIGVGDAFADGLTLTNGNGVHYNEGKEKQRVDDERGHLSTCLLNCLEITGIRVSTRIIHVSTT